MALFEYSTGIGREQYDMEDYFVFEPKIEKEEKQYTEQLEFDFDK
jgi:hypothetical protein